jgi:hypothetical protein
VEYKPLAADALILQFDHSPSSVRVYSPDLPEPRDLQWDGASTGKPCAIDLSGIRRFFVVQI